MDVHRSRFVKFPSAPVTAVAFSRAHDDGLTDPALELKLAIGRQNGQIEIWNPQRGDWVQESVFLGDGKSIDGIAWTRDPDEKDSDGQLRLGQYRLFSIASSPAVTEWDLERGDKKRTSTGNFSEVWCFAAQPRLPSVDDGGETAQELAAGCGDGTIVLLSTANDDLQFKRFVARVPGKKAKCVSIAFQTRDRVLAGFMDSTIRVFDVRNGANVRTMSLGAGLPQAPKNVIVWQVRCLSNGNIVSGDSNGEVVFWDGRSYSLTQRLRGHDSECLDLVTSADGKTIMSGSNDGRLAIFRNTASPAGRSTWAKIHHRRTHEGQVKAMAAFDGPDVSVVVSGGSDLVATATPLREYGKESNRPLSLLPQRPPLVSSRHARYLVSWWEKSISIWRIARKSSADSHAGPPAPQRRLVARLQLQIDRPLRDVAISTDGRLLSACTSSEVKVFQLRRRPDTDALAIRQLSTPKDLATSGARLLRFAPNGKWLVAVNPENEVNIVRISSLPAQPKRLHILPRVVELDRHRRHTERNTGFSSYERTICQLTFSPDSSVLATGDLSGYLDAWILVGHEDPAALSVDIVAPASKQNGDDSDSDDASISSGDSDDSEDGVFVFFGQHWTAFPRSHLLPKLDSAPLVLSFRPASALSSAAVNGASASSPYLLWTITSLHQIHELDLHSGGLSAWSRTHSSSSSLLPEDFRQLRDRVKGAIWDVSASRQRVWLYAATWLFMLDVSDAGSDQPSEASRRRRRESSSSPPSHGRVIAAGRRIPPHLRTESSGVVKRLKTEGGEWVEMGPDDDDDDDDDEGEGEEEEKEEEDDEPTAQELTQHQHRPWWCSFKYRPVLGIVELEPAARDRADSSPLEVALVERPLWESRNGVA